MTCLDELLILAIMINSNTHYYYFSDKKSVCIECINKNISFIYKFKIIHINLKGN